MGRRSPKRIFPAFQRSQMLSNIFQHDASSKFFDQAPIKVEKVILFFALSHIVVEKMSVDLCPVILLYCLTHKRQTFPT